MMVATWPLSRYQAMARRPASEQGSERIDSPAAKMLPALLPQFESVESGVNAGESHYPTAPPNKNRSRPLEPGRSR